MYTTRAKTFELLQIMIQDVKKLQIRLDSMATQLEKMDDLAQKVEAPSNAQPIQPSYKTTVSRPEATKKNPDDISPTKGKKKDRSTAPAPPTETSTSFNRVWSLSEPPNGEQTV